MFVLRQHAIEAPLAKSGATILSCRDIVSGQSGACRRGQGSRVQLDTGGLLTLILPAAVSFSVRYYLY